MALKGARQHLNRLKRLSGKRLQRDIFKALEAGAQRIRDDARASLLDGGASASRPGAPPNADTGELARSITVSADPDTLSLTISATAPHAADLEFGSSRIAERPFLAPAVQKHRETIVKDIAAVVRNTLRRA